MAHRTIRYDLISHRPSRRIVSHPSRPLSAAAIVQRRPARGEEAYRSLEQQQQQQSTQQPQQQSPFAQTLYSPQQPRQNWHQQHQRHQSDGFFTSSAFAESPNYLGHSLEPIPARTVWPEGEADEARRMSQHHQASAEPPSQLPAQPARVIAGLRPQSGPRPMASTEVGGPADHESLRSATSNHEPSQVSLVTPAYSLESHTGAEALRFARQDVHSNSTASTAPQSPVDARRGAFSVAQPAQTALELLPAFMETPVSAGPLSAPPVSHAPGQPWMTAGATSQHQLPQPHAATSSPAPPAGAIQPRPAQAATAGPPGATGNGSTFVFTAANTLPSSSPLLALSQLGQLGQAAHKTPDASSPQRRRVSGPSRARPQLTAINTTSVTSSPTDQPVRPTQASVGTDGHPAAIAQIGVLLDEVVSLAANARELFRQGSHGPSSMCLNELSRSLNRIGELGTQSLAQIQKEQQGDGISPQVTAQQPLPQSQLTSLPQQSQQQSAQAEASRPMNHSFSGLENQPAEQGHSTAPPTVMSLPPESPGIRKRPPNPKDELPVKTMRGQHGIPIDPPAAPPSAPPSTTLNSSMANGELPFEPPRSAPPPMTHTSSAPLVPQMKHFGPPALGTGAVSSAGTANGHVQSQGWHDPGAGTISNFGPPMGTSQANVGFSQGLPAGGDMEGGLPSQTLPASPRTQLTHARTRSLLDEAFMNAHQRSLQGGVAGADDDDTQWQDESGGQSPEETWSPSQDVDDSLTAFERQFGPMDRQPAGVQQSNSEPQSRQPPQVISLKGATDAPDMPGRGPIPPLPVEVQEKLDALFYRFLRYVCSNIDCADSNGEGIHQTLMPKRMSRLNHSENFRPFKFRIQAFVNRWQEEVYKNGIAEDQCSPKRLRQYLWTQPYISRFNEDGRKAKSKGNHVWIVEGRKLSDEEWEFQRFERKIVGPADKVARIGSQWSWILRVWDPQMSATSIKPIFAVSSKPAWMEFNDGDDNAEKSLSGTPDAHSIGGLVSVTAQCYHPNGTLQNLELSFEITVSPPEADETKSLDAPSSAALQNSFSAESRHSHASTTHHGGEIPLQMVEPVHAAIHSMPVSVAHAMPATQGSPSMMSGQMGQAPLAHPMMPYPQSGPNPMTAAMLPQPSQNATQFFASMNYPFTPPEAYTSQPALFFTDGNGDSPMPGAEASRGLGLDGTASASAGHGNDVAASFGQQLSAPSAPVANTPLEPHGQIQRQQVRAIIERMQRDQTASLSLKLPSERRKSTASQFDVEAEHEREAQQQQQQKVQQAHMQLQLQQQAQAQAQAVPMPPLGQPISLPPPTGSTDQRQDGQIPAVNGHNAANLNSSPIPPVAAEFQSPNVATSMGFVNPSPHTTLSPAHEMNPFADLSFDAVRLPLQQPPNQ
ncbi:unnamed protein product [Parajaminaea phylloscopi]